MPGVLNGLEWQTCLRRVLFLNANDRELVDAVVSGMLTAATVEVFRSQEAYRFLVEVVCGLNSPIVGETAVMGQFKEFSGHARFSKTPWGAFLRQLTANLMTDAKRVRHHHLQGIGSQSYGSLVRQHVKGLPTVAVLGAGKLAREILPWRIGKTKVRVFCRNLERARELLKADPEIHLEQDLDSDAGWEHKEAGLVIAAPIKANWVERWANLQRASFLTCVYLHGDATTDSVSMPSVI